MEIKCGICRHQADAAKFIPEKSGPEDPDWECPKCGCGVFVPGPIPGEFLKKVEVQP